jgi:hypothetical protein
MPERWMIGEPKIEAEPGNMKPHQWRFTLAQSSVRG